jgi:hypothetical protein
MSPSVGWLWSIGAKGKRSTAPGSGRQIDDPPATTAVGSRDRSFLRPVRHGAMTVTTCPRRPAPAISASSVRRLPAGGTHKRRDAHLPDSH